MPQQTKPPTWPDPRYAVGPVLYADDFTDPKLANWTAELETGGTVAAQRGKLIIDVPKGATVWLRKSLEGPVLIEYDAVVVQRGGPNDRASDLNCFWMAQDPRRPDRLLDQPRSGKFADYDSLTTYYVGYGGNGNTTTRFRRYIGRPGDRPLLPQYDLKLRIVPNAPAHIRLVACGPIVQYWHDDDLVFDFTDGAPYTRGWFAFRTTDSHLEISGLRIRRLIPQPTK